MTKLRNIFQTFQTIFWNIIKENNMLTYNIIIIDHIYQEWQVAQRISNWECLKFWFSIYFIEHFQNHSQKLTWHFHFNPYTKTLHRLNLVVSHRHIFVTTLISIASHKYNSVFIKLGWQIRKPGHVQFNIC